MSNGHPSLSTLGKKTLRVLCEFCCLLPEHYERTQKNPADKEYLNPSSIENFFKPIKKLFDMSGVGIAWKRIYSTFPESDNKQDTRGYTRQEIKTMLDFAQGAIDKAIILVASSSGVRVGGLTALKWEDVEPVYKVDDKLVFDITESEASRAQLACAIIKVYRTTNDEYPTFITPEAYNVIMNYKIFWINEIKREPKPKSALLNI